MELASGIVGGGVGPAAPVPVPANASFINSVAFLNVSSSPSVPSPPFAPAAAAASALPNIVPISLITSSSLFFNSLSSIASKSLAVSPKEPISDRLFTMEKRMSWRYFQMISLVLSVMSSVAQISRKSTPGRNSMLARSAEPPSLACALLTRSAEPLSLACALSAPLALFVAPAEPAPLSLLASLTVLCPVLCPVL